MSKIIGNQKICDWLVNCIMDYKRMKHEALSAYKMAFNSHQFIRLEHTDATSHEIKLNAHQARFYASCRIASMFRYPLHPIYDAKN